MDERTTQLLFALLRSAICGTKLTEEERALYTVEQLSDLVKTASKHDVVHLLVLGLKQNQLIAKEDMGIEQCIFKAVFRYEQFKREYESLCAALEKAQIPFLPLKGSVIRKYYPEAWMRTSCDIDVLVHSEDLEKAISYLTENLQYVEKERATHDVSLFSPTGIHVELHFDLVEEGRANLANSVLETVWSNVVLKEEYGYWYEMTDPFFYFYHIAHMAKHFETGGCGIRPFIDLWLLDTVAEGDLVNRDALLQSGELLRFTQAARKLSRVWFGGEEADALSQQLQHFLLHGGAYGSTDNRVALQQSRKGGRLQYIFSRVFAPYEKLRAYYPILEKHRWLMPAMQVRRWFMLLRPDVAAMAKSELAASSATENKESDSTGTLLEELGIHTSAW